MTKTFLASDHHLGHPSIIKFADQNGNIHRKFSSIEEHDEYLIERHNAVVSPKDKVYFIGDFAMRKKSIKLAERFNGRKTLILGNHDIFNTHEYTPYFENVRAYKVLNLRDNRRVILSHIPIHIESMGRFAANIHGHLHANNLRDTGIHLYFNLSMEQLDDYTPVDFDTFNTILNADH
jgi:calcineurin-like phosphoesterase family protein